MFFYTYSCNGLPTNLESWGIFLVVRENFIYHPCFSQQLRYDCYIFNRSSIVACLVGKVCAV